MVLNNYLLAYRALLRALDSGVSHSEVYMHFSLLHDEIMHMTSKERAILPLGELDRARRQILGLVMPRDSEFGIIRKEQ